MSLYTCGTTAIGPIGITMIVVPSGAAALTASAVMRPIAPGLFSTIDRLAERRAHLVGDDARDDVGGAAGREPDENPDRLVDLVLCDGGNGAGASDSVNDGGDAPRCGSS